MSRQFDTKWLRSAFGYWLTCRQQTIRRAYIFSTAYMWRPFIDEKPFMNSMVRDLERHSQLKGNGSRTKNSGKLYPNYWEKTASEVLGKLHPNKWENCIRMLGKYLIARLNRLLDRSKQGRYASDQCARQSCGEIA